MKTIAKAPPMAKSNGVVLQYFPGYFLIGCLLFSLVGLYFLLKPFLVALLFAAILAAAFHSFYTKILNRVGNRKRIAAFLTCFVILILIVIPLMIFVLLLGKQAFDTYTLIFQKVQGGEFDFYLQWHKGNVLYDFLTSFQSQFNGVIDFQKLDLKNDLVNSARNVSSFLVQESATFLRGLGSIIASFIILFFALYYFLKDAPLITQKLSQISPLPVRYDLELFRKFKEISKATLYGIFLTSIAQGMLGGIGFMIVGIPNALFWGTAMAFFSLIPVIGTSMIWLPATIILFATGNITGGIILLLWGILLISTIDNFLRAFLIGNQVNMNPLFAFLSVFGGIALFGLIGVIFGPLILTLFFTFLHIYELEYRSVLRK